MNDRMSGAGRALMVVLAAGLGGVMAGGAAAQVPSYAGFEVQAATGLTLFNLPSGSSISSETPVINNTRQVAFRFIAPNITGYWRGQSAAGSVFWTVDQSTTFFLTQGASINNAGVVVWAQDAVVNGIYRFAPPAAPGFVTSQPLGTQTFGSPTVNDAGQIGYRAGFGTGQAWASYDPGTNSTAVHAAEATIAPGSGINFLFTPTINAQRLIAGKIARGASNTLQEIRLYAASGASTIVAVAADVDPLSPFQGFDNSVAVNDAGDVAFIATRTAAAGGGRGVFLKRASSSAVTTIALQGQNGISANGSNNIEFFGPALNNNGVVAFRAFNASQRRSIWVGDGSTLVPVITRGDPITGPQGQSLTVGRLDTSPDFGGGIDINDAGDVVFNVQVNDGVQVVGAMITVARARPACYANCDGSTISPVLNALDFSCFLQRYVAADPYANCDGSTISPVLNALDFSCFLQRYVAGCP